ncbi:FAD-binding oxidoreductase [Leifsonia sp. 1010]|uniref:FAD-binding oxidoreductase n=1 Tax=Leifsonia sp. 1010 TaxID=2817769 RepID=UPI002858322E|nr:FAD-binding oxidoreductase [Leifsonia sp. 1010]MDR6611706.1 FAD/FMN-containing dehydrogenase [Leifsonia sp. 1010]
MGIELDTNAVSRLRDAVTGTVYVRGDDGLAAEVACFNPAIRHDPDIVVAVASDDDVVEAIRFAREAGVPVRVQATGHGAEAPIVGGMIVSTRGLDGLSIDAASRRARIGAGLRWAPVIVAAAEHGLAPVTGSSTGVGAVGYTLGGGVGPLARRYGFTSDWVRGFRVVTADGELVTADRETNPDLFWALRGGKGGLAVVTEMTLELVELRSLYGGSVFFEGGAIEPALRAWVDWSAELPDEATTSVVLLNVPDVEGPPPFLRGRTLLSVRFAYPGDPAEGEQLFAPIRAAAPVSLDFVAEMPTTAVASIHSDPEEGGPTWIRGFMLDSFDQDSADVILELAGPGSGSPFVAAEIRQLGGATARDLEDGSSVGGRDSGFTLSLIAGDPSTFAEAAPARARAIAEALHDTVSAITNVNFAGDLSDRAAFERVWPPAISERLQAVRRQWDPDRVFAFGPA